MQPLSATGCSIRSVTPIKSSQHCIHTLTLANTPTAVRECLVGSRPKLVLCDDRR